MPDEGRQSSPISTPPDRLRAKGSLRHMLTIAMVLMAVVPALVGAVLLGLGGRTLIRAEVFRHMQSVAQGACLEVGHILEARVDATDAFTRRRYVRQAVGVLTTGVAEERMGVAQARALLADQLADLCMPSGRREGGAVIVSLPGGRPLAWGGQSAAQAARAAAYHKADLPQGVGEPSVSPVHLDATTQAPVVCFIQALPPSPTGPSRPAAALIWSVALAPTVYATLDARTGLGETGEIVLVDHTGLALKDLRYESGTRLRKTIHTEPVERALRGNQIVGDSLDYRGVPVVAAVAQVPTTRWGIVAKLDLAEAYVGITRLVWLWGGLMVALLLVAAAAARKLSRHLLRPVEALSAAAHAVAEGATSAGLDTGRTDELGQMAQAFDTMVTRMAASRATLEVALEQARETRSYLDNLLDYANAPIVVWDTELRITRFNSAFERLTGRSELGVLGEQVTILLPEAELERHMDAILGATAGERWDAIEIPTQHVDGSIRTLLWNSAAVYSPDGETVVAAVAQGQDITDRKRAEEALQASEERYRSLFTNMLNGLARHEIILDEQGKPTDYRFLEVNASFEAMLGLKREQVIGRLASEVFPQLQPSWLKTYGQVALTGSAARFDEYAEGLDRWFAVQAYSPRHGEFITFFDDITIRKAAEAALRQSEARFRSVFDEAAVGIAVTAMDKTHLDCNQALLDMLGLTREQFLSTQAEEFTHPDDRHADPTPWLELVAGQRTSYQREVRYLRPDGSVISTRLTVSLAAYGSEGQPVALTMMEDITERRNAEEALRLAHEQLQSVITSSPAAIIIQSPVHGIELYSPAAETLFGWKAEEVLGLEFAPYVGAQFEAEATALRRRIAAHETITGHETQRLRRDGSLIDVSISMAPITEGEPGRFVAVVSDISESKRMERALQEALARLQAIITYSPAGIVISDWEGQIELYSPAAERMFGWREEEVLGGEAPHVPPEGREEIGCILREVRAGRTVHALETQRLRRDGSHIEVSISIAPLIDPDGESRRFIAVITDLCERQRAEHEAAERGALEELLQVTERMLAASSPNGLLEQLVEGVRELTEAALCTAAYGYHEGEFVFDALSHTEELDLSPAAVALRAVRDAARLKLVETNAPVRLTAAELAALSDFALPAPDLPLHGFVGTPLTDASRETVGMIMASNKADGSDLNARDEAMLFQLTALGSLALRHLDLNLALSRQAAELEASNRELASFSHSVSHDLRAPLRAVDGFSRALLEDYGSKLDAQALDYLTRLRAATQRMGELIDDLLQLSRVTREAMRWEEVDLSALATEIAAELDESEPSRTVVWRIEPELRTTGHPRLLGVLLRNLLGNAFKFTGKTPEAVVEFGAEQMEGKAVYFVKDNGAGFDMAYADKLFAPFQRLHAMEEFPGNGVGLATVQRVINRHGGKVWAEAVVGKGATFRFTF